MVRVKGLVLFWALHCFPKSTSALPKAPLRWQTQCCVGERIAALENAILLSTQNCVVKSRDAFMEAAAL